MAGPLLETKLHIPRRRRGLVARPRLRERLSLGAEAALTLVSAPAGFGKTTLLAEWLAAADADGSSAAWVSLDERDNDPALFWPYLLAAIERAAPGVGRNAGNLLESPQTPIEVVLATLLNDFDAISHDVVLVLDDYHVIDAREVQDGMAYLLEHLPEHLHVVLASRADPALPLARLRGRGELVELRAADLRFTPDEAAAYLNDAMGLDLTAQDVAALETRTEGWITAIQLAALSMQGRDDIPGFIAGFAGDDRYIVDYLVEEVLQRQPEDRRIFLLQTSILSRLTGSLCDAVTGQDDGKTMLESIDRGNLFLVPLDDRRRWYRYHHLFADVLRARLLDEQPDDLPDLHRRASEWYEHNGDLSEAFRHALAGKDFERAADLIELAIPALRKARQDATLQSWLEALPDEVIKVRPVLSLAYIGAILVRGEVEGVEAGLQQAERWLSNTTDDDQFRDLPVGIANYRAGQAQLLGDVETTMTHARRALELARQDDHVGRGASFALLGLASWTSGDLDAAQRWYAQGMASLEQAGYISDVVGGAITVADLQIAQGRLREAMTTYTRGLQRATAPGAPVLRGAADMHVGMSQLLTEHNDLDAARRHLLASRELGDHAGLPKNPYRWRVAMARIRQAEGDPAGALELLDEAERVYAGDFSPNVRPIPALRARVWIAMGRIGEALGWAHDQGLSVEDDLSYVREFEHITFAKVLVAQHTADPAKRVLADATRFLERLRRAAEEGARAGSVLEILVLQALAHQAGGDMPAALAALERTLTLAEREGYVRIFVDEGSPMGSLLRAAAKKGTGASYVRRLLNAIDQTAYGMPVDQGLIEPLSERELDVLRLLGTDLDGPDIARELIVSLNTVRTHTKNIYAKLGVNSRRAAVRRAQELDLLSRTR